MNIHLELSIDRFLVTNEKPALPVVFHLDFISLWSQTGSICLMKLLAMQGNGEHSMSPLVCIEELGCNRNRASLKLV